MKKLLLIVALFANIGVISAQNYAEIFITNIQGGNVSFDYCTEIYDGAIIHGVPECDMNVWYVNGEQMVSETIIVYSYNQEQWYSIDHEGCNLWVTLGISFVTSDIENPFYEPIIWKHPGETITIGRDVSPGITYEWNTEEHTPTIDVSEDGIYSVTLTDICGSETFSVEVRDNVEIDLATCDLESNLNLVTWPTTVAQAQYIDHVIVKRDGMQVGTAPYSDGQFTDNIGSGAASRTYTVTAIATDGTECPIVSYPKETIHMSYTLGMNSTIEIGWNTPTGYDLLGYNICEWHEEDGSLSVVDFVGASVTSYTCSESQFDEGYIVVQGVEADKDSETRLLSNRSLDLVGIGENETAAFKVYPNPAKDRVTIEGSGTMTVTNALGQTVMTKEIDGKATIELPQGMYFVKLGGATRKIVVE